MDIKYSVMDATNMDYENNSFDVVIDKGTLDALICSKNLVLGMKLLQ